MVKTALYVHMEAKPGKEAEVQKFLEDGLALVNQEPATTAWFAMKMGGTSFGIFDVFPDEAGRDAHLTLESGSSAAAFPPQPTPPAISSAKRRVQSTTRLRIQCRRRGIG